MTIADLIKMAEKAGNQPERVSSDKREAFNYMDVQSQHYRDQVKKYAK